jgi:hypothetical protein
VAGGAGLAEAGDTAVVACVAEGEGEDDTTTTLQPAIKSANGRTAIAFLICVSIVNVSRVGLLRIHPSEDPQQLPLTLA